ncbi:hypothetical protein G5V59_08635 [Nocardioides sp. W3-2-3]|uniref:protein kinase domain-containing protein n=1 Tax=Nocardioides convexus TaxID=2712224 RepID=UPI002418574F|nr:hypothetical protein [Nocardioides convexus]NHA00181.1 hypothetical protein [Nocardioides convexus]
MVAQVAGALDDAHRAGVLHRDIKPGNVLLRDADDRPLFAYLCDFGIAQPATGTRHTLPGDLVGTVAYLAPEPVRGGAGQPGERRLRARLPALVRRRGLAAVRGKHRGSARGPPQRPGAADSRRTSPTPPGSTRCCASPWPRTPANGSPVPPTWRPR